MGEEQGDRQGGRGDHYHSGKETTTNVMQVKHDDLPRPIRSALVVIKEVGFPMAVALYFFVKDWFFTEQLVTLMSRITIALDVISRKIQ